eukprot:Clim_evm5s180 gene=Clim_evmTU5s180
MPETVQFGHLFQAVIIASDNDSSLYPLTEQIPKALLPVGGHPQLFYQLKLLEKAGLEEVIIVVSQRYLEDFQQFESLFKNSSDGKLSLRITPVANDATTADALRNIKDLVNNDIIVLSSDIIVDIDLRELTDLHRISDASITCLLANATEVLDPSEQELRKQGAKVRGKDYIGLDGSGSRLVYMNGDEEQDPEATLKLSKSLVIRQRGVRLTNSLIDAHVYVLSRWVLDYILTQDWISSIRRHLLPYLVRNQFRKVRHVMDEADQQANELLLMGQEASNRRVANSAYRGSAPQSTQTSISSGINKLGEGGPRKLTITSATCVKCMALVKNLPMADRCNTVPTYILTNRRITKFLPTWELSLRGENTVVGQRSQIGADCIVGNGSQFGEKTTVKRSVIGQHCRIGSKVKIIDSIIMDYVTIKDEVTIQNTILCHQCLVENGASLKDCLVTVRKTIKAGAKHKNESIATQQSAAGDDLMADL